MSLAVECDDEISAEHVGSVAGVDALRSAFETGSLGCAAGSYGLDEDAVVRREADLLRLIPDRWVGWRYRAWGGERDHTSRDRR